MVHSNDETLAKTICCNIKNFREKLFPGHGGKKKCAEQFGVHAQMWRDWESGKRTPGANYQKKLADFFGISMSELRGEGKDSSGDDFQTLKSQLQDLTSINEQLRRQVRELQDQNLELSGALKHLKDLIATPKTADNASRAFSRTTRIKVPEEDV